MEAVEAIPDGVRLSQWIEAAPISRATAYQLLKVLGIETSKLPMAGSRVPVAVLSGPQVAVMDAAAAKVAGGVPVASLAATLATRPPPDHPWMPAGVQTQGSADHPQTTPLTLLQRLQAIELATVTGAPLTTAEVAQLLGARPGAAVVDRGRLRAERLARNCWILSALPPT